MEMFYNFFLFISTTKFLIFLINRLLKLKTLRTTAKKKESLIMPRTKPTLKLGVYGSFDINPEQAVSSYFESKLQDELY